MPKFSYFSTIFKTTTPFILLLLHIFDLSQCADYSTNKINRIAAPYQNSRTAQRDVPDSTNDNDGPDNQKFFGPNTEIKDYDTSEFNYIGGGPVRTGDELSTDFSIASCWSPNVNHNQKLKWKSAHNKPDVKKLQYYFNTANGPDNDYMVVYSRTKMAPGDYAVLESCSIMCAQGPVTVSLKYWASQGVILEVCNREVFFEDGEPGDCKKLPQQNQPGPAKISMTLKELSAVVIKASNFIDDKGSVAMIDEMEVDYTPCEDTTVAPVAWTSVLTRATPAGPKQPSSPEYDSPDTCQNVVCPFDQNLCSYVNMDFTSGQQRSRLFAPHRGRFRNLLTGIREGPHGDGGYASAYLLRQEIAGIRSGPVDLKEDRVLQMYLYEATQGITTRVCFNDEMNCPYRTQGVVQKDERKWKLMYWPVPKSTKKILLITENKGPNEGAVGFSTLRLLAAPINGGDPQTATRSTCLISRARTLFA